MDKSLPFLTFICVISALALLIIRKKGLKKEWSDSQLYFLSVKLAELALTFASIYFLSTESDFAIIIVLALIGAHVLEYYKFFLSK